MITPPMTSPTQSATKPGPITRRGFLGIAWGLVLAALTGEGAAAVWEFLRPPRPSGGFGGLVRAGRVEEFGPGSVSHVAAGQFFISRVDEGLMAMWHRCTHLGCTIPWIEAEGRFNCPCHGSIFNTRGEVLAGPAPRPMDLFAIQILEGEVWVDTSQPITRSAFDPTQVTQT